MFRAPSQAGLPTFAIMLADIPSNTAQVAKHLGLTKSTIERYKAAEQAPRSVMLALFWETRWGRSVADCEAANYGAVHARYAQSLERENAMLRRRISHLEELMRQRQPVAANSPFYLVG